MAMFLICVFCVLNTMLICTLKNHSIYERKLIPVSPHDSKGPLNLLIAAKFLEQTIDPKKHIRKPTHTQTHTQTHTYTHKNTHTHKHTQTNTDSQTHTNTHQTYAH